MCNTQKFVVIEPTQRGWRTSKPWTRVPGMVGTTELQA